MAPGAHVSRGKKIDYYHRSYAFGIRFHLLVTQSRGQVDEYMELQDYVVWSPFFSRHVGKLTVLCCPCLPGASDILHITLAVAGSCRWDFALRQLFIIQHIFYDIFPGNVFENEPVECDHPAKYRNRSPLGRYFMIISSTGFSAKYYYGAAPVVYYNDLQ